MIVKINEDRAVAISNTTPILRLLLLAAVLTCNISSCFGRGTSDRWRVPLASALLPTQRRKQRKALDSANAAQDDVALSSSETTYYWKEISPPTKTKKQLEDELDAMFDGPGSKYQVGGATKPPRRIIWYGSMDDDDQTYMPSKEIMKDHKKYLSIAERIQQLQQEIVTKGLHAEGGDGEDQPHPMRMDTYEIKINWKSRHLKRLQKQRRTQRIRKYSKLMSIEFHPNGYCRSKSILVEAKSTRRRSGNSVLSPIGIGVGRGESSVSTSATQHDDDNKTVVFGIGQWVIFPWGLMFNIKDCHGSNDISNDFNPTTYWFHCDLHLNSFGEYPKLMQGVVVKEDDDKEFSPFEELPSFNQLTVGIDDVDMEGTINYSKTDTATTLMENEYEDDEYNTFLLDHQLQQLMNMWDAKSDKEKANSWKKRRAGAKKWFLPVVATFSGIGVGEDTADFSYKDRGFGVSLP